MGQPFSCTFDERLIARIGKTTLSRLHFDVKAIVYAYSRAAGLAERLGISPPAPHLAGFAYCHVAALGCDIIFPEDSEPKPLPLISSPAEIDTLREPADYLKAPLIQKRLALLAQLKREVPGTGNFIGHLFEGPVTTAVLLLGEQFFTLPYDDPVRAHRLLEFCTESAINYGKTLLRHFDHPVILETLSIPDDFAGMFPPHLFEEFVLPYWVKLFDGFGASGRMLHSELLRVDHLHFLSCLNLSLYDPSADQYLTPEILKEHSPCPFSALIQAWEIHQESADELEARYIRYAKCRPASISFVMDRLEDEPKIRRLLEVARRLE